MTDNRTERPIVIEEMAMPRPELDLARCTLLRRTLAYIGRNSLSPEAHRLRVLLELRAGLLIAEIADVRVADVTRPDGSTSNAIRILRGYFREIPIDAQVRKAIDAFRRRYPKAETLSAFERDGVLKHANGNALTVWFLRLYQRVLQQPGPTTLPARWSGLPMAFGERHAR
jgi:hypothetical protein